jgi:hypothetical protein
MRDVGKPLRQQTAVTQWFVVWLGTLSAWRQPGGSPGGSLGAAWGQQG